MRKANVRFLANSNLHSSFTRKNWYIFVNLYTSLNKNYVDMKLCMAV